MLLARAHPQSIGVFTDITDSPAPEQYFNLLPIFIAVPDTELMHHRATHPEQVDRLKKYKRR
jgi:hypothetical protein